MRKKFLIIHNKMAGRLKAPKLAAVMAVLEKQGIEVSLQAADSVEEDIELAGEAARLGEVDAVVAAGGDSTLRGVAMGLVGTDMPLGIIPAGTGNVLAKEIGLGNAVQIADVLINGTTKKIGMGLANGEPFLLMAGAGFDAEIVKNLDHDLKQRIRKAAYIGPALKAFWKSTFFGMLVRKAPHKIPPALMVRFEEDEDSWPVDSDQPFAGSAPAYSAPWVVVTKVQHYGGSFVIAPDAELAANELQVVMFMDQTRLGMLRALAGLAMGKNAQLKKRAMDDKDRPVGNIMKTRGVMIRSTRKRVQISSSHALPTQIDGEWLGETPLEISSGDQSIELIVP